MLLLDYLGKKMFLKSMNSDYISKKKAVSRKNYIQNDKINFEYDSTTSFKNKKISKKILRRYQPDNNM